MAITIEDGTGKADADSFATVAEAQAFANARGFALPVTDAAIEKLLVKACDFMLGLEPQFQGLRTNQGQRLPFPRVRVVLFKGTDPVASDEIPMRLKEAQIRLAISANSSELRPDGAGREVIREKLGPLDTQFANRGSGTVHPQFNQAIDLLSPFFNSGGSGMIFVERA